MVLLVCHNAAALLNPEQKHVPRRRDGINSLSVFILHLCKNILDSALELVSFQPVAAQPACSKARVGFGA